MQDDANATVGAAAEQARQQVAARLQSISYLPTTASVAMRFVELGRNPDAEPADYARVISSDSSLSSKLLSLSNSSWAGVRNRVTTVRGAVNLLGLGTVRTLAISYCMTGLHNELGLSSQESEVFWEASLSKALAAKQYASLFDARLADEAFVAGLFQDFALAVLFSVLRDRYLGVLQDPQVDVATLLLREREMFGIDHAEVGRILALKLELPNPYVDIIGLHHNRERLEELVESVPLRDAALVASFLPHTLRCWNIADAGALQAFLSERRPGTDAHAFINEVQEEFTQLYQYFNEGGVPETQLPLLMADAARELANSTTALVGHVNSLLRDAAAMGQVVDERLRRLEDRATHDPLTGALLRQTFCDRAKTLLARAASRGQPVVLAYFDVDQFKQLNDSFGYAVGDQVLRVVVDVIRKWLSENALIGRMGGDEFVALLDDCDPSQAATLFREIADRVHAVRIDVGHQHCNPSVSIGVVPAPAVGTAAPLPVLIELADKLMYQAKRAGGNRVQSRALWAAVTGPFPSSDA